MDKRIFGGDFYRVDWNGYCKFINKLNPMTNKYKVGMILISEDGLKRKVLEVLENTLLVSQFSSFGEYISAGCWYSFREVDQSFTIEKEDWRPFNGDKYYYASDCGSVDSDVFDESFDYDMFRLSTKNCFSSKAEAEQRLSEIKKEYGIK